MYASVSPSYERTNSFLYICIAYHIIDIHRANNTVNCLRCSDYDSDHCAIQSVATNRDNTNYFTLLGNSIKTTFDYKKTNWTKIKKDLDIQLHKFFVPNDRNLSNTEII